MDYYFKRWKRTPVWLASQAVPVPRLWALHCLSTREHDKCRELVGHQSGPTLHLTALSFRMWILCWWFWRTENHPNFNDTPILTSWRGRGALRKEGRTFQWCPSENEKPSTFISCQHSRRLANSECKSLIGTYVCGIFPRISIYWYRPWHTSRSTICLEIPLLNAIQCRV